jgi:hypothetical protein
LNELVTYGVKNDMIFLVLFTLSVGGLSWLVKWILKTNDEREKRYISTIESLSLKLDIVKDIQKSVKHIEKRLEA